MSETWQMRVCWVSPISDHRPQTTDYRSSPRIDPLLELFELLLHFALRSLRNYWPSRRFRNRRAADRHRLNRFRFRLRRFPHAELFFQLLKLFFGGVVHGLVLHLGDLSLKARRHHFLPRRGL